MPEIVLTEEQARVVAGATAAVVIRDPGGAAVGSIDPRDAAVIAEAKRRLAAGGPRYSGAQVRAMLDALHAERARVGPFDATHADELARRLGRADPATYGPEEPA